MTLRTGLQTPSGIKYLSTHAQALAQAATGMMGGVVEDAITIPLPGPVPAAAAERVAVCEADDVVLGHRCADLGQIPLHLPPRRQMGAARAVAIPVVSNEARPEAQAVAQAATGIIAPGVVVKGARRPARAAAAERVAVCEADDVVLGRRCADLGQIPLHFPPRRQMGAARAVPIPVVNNEAARRYYYCFRRRSRARRSHRGT